ncbi:MAG: hypothetical protein KME40_22910 [Komarekiella atlantica HA4396-MV6]|nr:hypothetical protein [Komarekiella atlantica HA4396-MV6]
MSPFPDLHPSFWGWLTISGACRSTPRHLKEIGDLAAFQLAKSLDQAPC